MIKRALVAILTFGLTSSAHAIVSMENLHFGNNQPGMSGSIIGGLNGAEGNSKRIAASGSTTFQWNLAETVYYISLSGAYGESQKVKSQEEYFLHARRIANINSRMAWELFTQAEHDDFAKLNLRALAGGGLRILVGEKRENQAFFVGLGAFYSHELIDVKSNSINNEIKGNFYLLFRRKISNSAYFVNTLYAQPKIDDFADFRLLEHATLSVEVTNRISLNLDLEARHDNNPPPGVIKTDWKYSTGIKYRF